jgi:hypothetical protein
MAGQSLRGTDHRHSRTWGLAMIPAIANLVSIQLNGLIGSAGIVVANLPEETRLNLLALTMLGNGFIVTSMLWMSWLIWVIDGRLGRAALAAAVGAGLTLCGIIHSPFAACSCRGVLRPRLGGSLAAICCSVSVVWRFALTGRVDQTPGNADRSGQLRQGVSMEPSGGLDFCGVRTKRSPRVVSKERHHQGVRERPWLAVKIAQIGDLDSDFFAYFARGALFQGFSGLDKTGQGAEHFRREEWAACQQELVALLDQHHHRG